MHPYIHTYRLTFAFVILALLASLTSPAQTAAQSHNMAGMRGAASFNSGYMQAGQSFSHTFTVPGVYRYVCTLHETAGMKGVIIVKGDIVTHMAQVQVHRSAAAQPH